MSPVRALLSILAAIQREASKRPRAPLNMMLPPPCFTMLGFFQMCNGQNIRCLWTRKCFSLCLNKDFSHLRCVSFQLLQSYLWPLRYLLTNALFTQSLTFGGWLHLCSCATFFPCFYLTFGIYIFYKYKPNHDWYLSKTLSQTCFPSSLVFMTLFAWECSLTNHGTFQEQMYLYSGPRLH